MGRDDSWPATVPNVVPTGDCFHWSIHYIHKANRPISVSMAEVPTRYDYYDWTMVPLSVLSWNSYRESTGEFHPSTSAASSDELLMMVWSKRGNINTADLVTIAQCNTIVARCSRQLIQGGS